jgi:hypothetical protein
LSHVRISLCPRYTLYILKRHGLICDLKRNVYLRENRKSVLPNAHSAMVFDGCGFFSHNSVKKVGRNTMQHSHLRKGSANERNITQKQIGGRARLGCKQRESRENTRTTTLSDSL